MATSTSNTTYTPARTKRFSAVDTIALILMIVGGLNWGLVGLLGFDLVAAIFGPMSLLSRVVYVLVGLAALYGISLLFSKRAD